MSSNNILGVFIGTGVSTSSKYSRGYYNVSVWGNFVGTIQLQRSFDGVTWLVAKELSAASEGYGYEAEDKVLYRFECTAYTSGSINYRMGMRNAN